MKKYIIYTLIVTIAVFLGSCNKDDIDTKRSIFDPTEVYEPNEFDKWLLDNYVYTYNIQVKYRLDDNETDVEYHLVPAKYDNAITLAKIVKFVWMEAYDEIWGIDMTRTYVPKLLQFIGNVAYTESGMILGQAEGGMKVTLLGEILSILSPEGCKKWTKEVESIYPRWVLMIFSSGVANTKKGVPALVL